ncbi:mechanosensitive ion channel family protein [Pedobacter sp. SAFR-022]|uniref:mechanosensitive ion channel family protein n=1 Tax=Pedobacter sp. SAFR-022 TaxID=3436861 RepID=UPI003F821D0C
MTETKNQTASCLKLKTSFSIFLRHTGLFIWMLLMLQLEAQAQAELLQPDTAAKQAAVVYPPDSLGRRNPRGTVEGFIKAAAREQYKIAANYLNLDTKLKDSPDSVKVAKALQVLLDKGNIYPYSWISDNGTGQQDDNLGPNQDRIGAATINGESFDLILESITDTTGGPIWLFSSQTIQRVPIDTAVVQNTTMVEQVSPGFLEETEWGGVPVAHWLAMVLIVVLSYILAGLIIRFLVYIIPLVWHRARTEATAGIIQSFVLPIRLYLAVWLFVVASRAAGISIIVRQRLTDLTLIVGVVAFLLLLWQLLDFITRLVEKRMLHHGNQSGVSALLFLRRAAKVALVIFGSIIILDTFGWDVTTWLTALGIGGIAIALGTQKTVENFVGSVTLIADHPVRVGDFCLAGGVLGTVEQIGMRTTKIRTLGRTVVSIPNGELSSLKIENFAPRDKFLFNPTLGLRYETTPEQLRYLLVELRAILFAHPKIDSGPRIRFTGFAPDSLKLEVWSYIKTISNDEFLEVQEDLYLRFMEVVEASGTGFAFPSQTIYFAKDTGVSEEKTKDAESRVRAWREAGDLQIPNFSPEKIMELKDTIKYPAEGTSMEPK